jgi:predicted enzyme related to lactoylglutathione lyase
VKLESHATVLQVPDVQAALAWFRDALGFEARGYEDGSGYGYAERDGVWFHVSRPDPHLWSAYLYTDDVDALHAELVERGTEILQPPTDKGYGVRDVIVRAPGGHVLAIGQLLDR